jgi:hypothetical protein
LRRFSSPRAAPEAGEKAVLFLKKKNQKDFYETGPRVFEHPGSR